MVDLLRDLREGHVIAAEDGRWSLARALPELWLELPETVRSMIQRKLERLDDGDRRLLGVAAAQGHEFDSAVVAAAVMLDPATVEERMQVLERVHGLVRLLREDEFPDRTLTMRYAFVHALYQQALYGDLSPTRRTAISRALAQSLESRYGDESASVAAELACLYEAGRDFLQGARQFHQASQNAAQVFAHRDAVQLARRGLGLLEGLARSAVRDALELSLQTTLGLQLQVTEGYGSEPARLAYNRARELCVAAPPAALFPVLWGLWLVHKVRSELPYAQEIADELLALAVRLHDPNLALQAHQALGLTALCRGQPARSLRHIEQVATLYNPELHRTHAFLFGQDPGVICKAYGAVALWLLGHPDAAQRQSEHAIEMSRDLSPTSQAVALHFAAMVYQLCRDPARARQCAEASVAISAEHGFRFWRAGGLVIGGWALAAEGEEAGLVQLRQGLSEWDATGSVTYLTYYLGLLADVLTDPSEAHQRRRVLDEALLLAIRTDERMCDAELHRLRGETIMLAPGDNDCAPQARQEFERAWSIARAQEARALELRAAISLARLHNRVGGDERSRDRLADSLSCFPGQTHSPDIAEARALLAAV
jgi:predicted ATPase